MTKNRFMTKYRLTQGTTIPLTIFFIITGMIPQALIAFAISLLVTVWGVVSLRSGIFGQAIVMKPQSDSIYLTFDDGPDPELTPKVLELLEGYGLHATFFLIAQKAQQYPAIVSQILAKGHTIGSHDLIHPWWANFRLKRQLRREISESLRILSEITGQEISIYRPPVGLSNPDLHWVCRKIGVTIIGWNRAAFDGGNRVRRAIKKIPGLRIKRGDIILLHDSAPDEERRTLFIESLEKLFTRINSEKLLTKSL